MRLIRVVFLLFGLILTSFCLINEKMCSSEFKNRLIYCEGKILEAVHYHQLYRCSKDFVDSPLRYEPEKVLNNFYKRFPMKIENISREKLVKFVQDNFEPPGSELIMYDPIDWDPMPANLLRIQDKQLRDWALELHNIWKILCRRVSPDVKKHPDRHSILWLDEPFIIPGGLYREDSYWICRGLIASGMFDTAKGIALNLANFVETLGFVPNGNRIYYTRRTQPPFLIRIVFDIYEKTDDLAFLKSLLPVLVKEFEFWDRNRKFELEWERETHQVYFYRTLTDGPRPENIQIDLRRSSGMSNEEKKRFYRSVSSAAESGWDFSSRWMRDGIRIQSMDTQNTAPVDLNAFQCGNLKMLTYLHEIVGDTEKALKFRNRFVEFKETVQRIFYDKLKKTWFDVDFKKVRRIEIDFASASAPLYTGCYDGKETTVLNFYERFSKGGFFDFNGIPASMTKNATQQWDFPLSWPPLNHMIVEGFRKSSNPWLQNKAIELAQKWIDNNFRVFNQTRLMFEKYNVLGSIPNEFDVQLGFGWSNGVILDLLSTYYDQLRAPESD